MGNGQRRVGVGAAGIAPVIMAYIMMEFPPEKMGQGFTVYMALSCGMVIFGPTVGGIIMALIGTADAWRIVMWICVALCVISFVCCSAMVRDNPDIPKLKPDPVALCADFQEDEQKFWGK